MLYAKVLKDRSEEGEDGVQFYHEFQEYGLVVFRRVLNRFQVMNVDEFLRNVLFDSRYSGKISCICLRMIIENWVG